MTQRWPDKPQPGELVRLPLPLAPMLCDAIGYTRGGRYIALYWLSAEEEAMLMCNDGPIANCVIWCPWQILADHPLVGVILEPYQLGDPAHTASHWLLIDRWANTLDIGLPADVDRLLSSQPCEANALLDNYSADQLDDLLDAAIQDAARPLPIDDVIRDHFLRQHELSDALRECLDRLQVHFDLHLDL